jgi:hypothetical protein
VAMRLQGPPRSTNLKPPLLACAPLIFPKEVKSRRTTMISNEFVQKIGPALI